MASRTMLITGRYVWDAARVEPNLAQEAEGGRLWPQRMAAAGYETYFAGKWHVGIDRDLLFDLREDPEERHDLAGEPGQAGRVAELREALRSLQQDMGDPLLDAAE